MRQTQTAAGPRRTRRWAPLITLALAAAALAPVSVAQAGEWAQRSCSFGTEYIAPEGWEGKENHGYDTMPNDNCERFSNGGGLLALATGFDGSEPFTGQTWLYKAPHDSTIAGGVLQRPADGPPRWRAYRSSGERQSHPPCTLRKCGLQRLRQRRADNGRWRDRTLRDGQLLSQRRRGLSGPEPPGEANGVSPPSQHLKRPDHPSPPARRRRAPGSAGHC